MNLDRPDLFREQAFVAGVWRDQAGGRTLDIVDPARGTVIARVPALTEAETGDAVAAAAAAFPAWRALTARERGQIVRRWYDLIVRHQEDIARIMTAENGKPLAEARGEVMYAANFVSWYAEEAKRIYGEIVPEAIPGRRVLLTKAPVGVAAAITPWNFPAAMITRECAPALVAGCPIIVKPAEQTPLTALALAVLAEEAGVPKGVLQVVTGAPEVIGGVLLASPVVRKIGFTGSNAVGRLLYRQSADTMKRISLELGGSAPFIVFDDADLDVAVGQAMMAKFRNNGQTCVSANRFLVHETVAPDFVGRLAEKVAAVKVGPGDEPGVLAGPLIDGQGFDKVCRHVEDAIAKGARAIIGGKPHKLGGTFYEPTVLTGVNTQMLITQEETFGPVAPVMTFSTEDQAVDLANATPFGLMAYFFTRDLGRGFRVQEALDFGMIGVNTGMLATDSAPMGGVKQSGLGKVGGRQGLEEYLDTKYVAMSGM